MAVIYRKYKLFSRKIGTELLEALEDIPEQPVFSELTLSSRFRKALGLPQEEALFFGPWGHNHMGNKLPKVERTRDGVERSVVFGDAYAEYPSSMVKLENGFVVFPEAA